MDIRNLSIVFSPTLNIPTPVILMFLSEFDAIFNNHVEGEATPSNEPSTTQSLTTDDIRSPRRQMFSDIPTPAFNQTSFISNSQATRREPAMNGIHSQQDLGFAPLQPSYDALRSTSQTPRHEEKPFLNPSDSGIAIARPRNLTPADSSVKQSRRESSMLLMGPGSRKSSLGMMRNDQN